MSGSISSRPLVRVFRTADQSTIRTICCDTAFYGTPIEAVFEDRDWIADSLVSYYARFEPESSFVAEVNGRVVGYLNGCLETKRFERMYTRWILPGLVWKALVRGHWCRRRTRHLMGALFQIGRMQLRDRPLLLKEFPAHCHVNLARGARRAGIGSDLLHRFLDHLRSRNVPGIHVSVATDPGKAFFAKAGFRTIVRYPLPKMPAPAPSELWLMGRSV